MPDAVLVDGYNVLHAIPRFAPRGGDVATARETFERWLAQVIARQGMGDCVLVWDGRRQRRGSHPQRGLQVVYTESGVTADERILELCRERYAERADSTLVVSSDREIQGRARQLGFPVMGAMTFYRRWSAGSTAESRRSVGADAGKPRATRAEVDRLLEEFLARRGDADGGDR